MRLLVFPGARLGAARPGRPLGRCDADGNDLFEQIRRSKERSLLSTRPASGTGKLTADWIKCDTSIVFLFPVSFPHFWTARYI